MHRLALLLLPLFLFAGPPTDERLRQFRDDKFGMFIHWGPYSRLAGEAGNCRVPLSSEAEWIMKTCRIPALQYREMARSLNPVQFDANAWVSLARQAGTKYMVMTAKHHDGFAMYHSSVSRYNIVDWTPFGRDPLQELAASCRRAGMRLGVYYSHREDWDDPDAYGNDWDYTESNQDFRRYLERKSKPQLRELLTKYGPIALIWFDRGMDTEQHAQEFVELVRDLQPKCLVSGRVGSYDQELMGDYQSLGDNGMAPGGLDEPWETPQTLNQTWGYSQFDHQWKTPSDVVRRLVEIVSKGGNYLLNVGPKGDGTIPAQTISTLERVGRWVERNGDSIYGTAACPLALTPWGHCTVKGERLYLHVFDWPKNGLLRVEGIPNRIVKSHLLAEPDQSLRIERQGKSVLVHAPIKPPDLFDSVIVLDLDGQPEADPAMNAPDSDGTFRLDYKTALTSGRAAKRFNRAGGFHIATWTGREDSASWFIQGGTAGRYTLRIAYAATENWKDAPFTATVGANVLRGKVQPTGDSYKYQRFELGTVEIRDGGQYKVSVRPSTALDHQLMRLEALELLPEVSNGLTEFQF